MSGFFRRFDTMPPKETLTEIEGVVVIDGQQPGQVAGIGSGVACIIGEFADCTYGVNIDANGVVTTLCQPVEVFSSADLDDKLGGFDETLGEFGGVGGNGWLELKNKRFPRLVAAPINYASSQGIRVWRKLATCTSATDPNPIVEVTGAAVAAGTEFKNGNNRVHLAARVRFQGTVYYWSATDGGATSAGAAAFQSFTSASGTFQTFVRPDGKTGVQVGDIVVIGVIGGAGALGANADTYRVRLVTSGTALSLEKLDGTNFDWTTTTNLPYRIHPGDVADTGGLAAVATQSGYRIPARPLDATIAINLLLTPTVVPDALTGTTAAPLSGLMARSAPVTGLVYTATIQAPNAVNNAAIDSLYDSAINALLADDLPEREVNIMWSARHSDTIATLLRAHVLRQKQNGIGRMAHIAPALSQVNVSTVLGDVAPGVGANRAREVVYNWPGVLTFVKEAVGKSVKIATGVLVTDGYLDVPSDGFAVMCESVIAPERNPGEASDNIKTAMAKVVGLQSGLPAGMDINVYKRMKARGIMGPRIDRNSGPIFQSGVTSSLNAGEKEINVRRFSFFIQDSLAAFLAPLAKLPMSEQLKDETVARHIEFFDGLKSTRVPSAARIRDYIVDPIGGNRPDLENAGVFVVKHLVEMISIAEVLVVDSKVGYGVIDVSVSLAA